MFFLSTSTYYLAWWIVSFYYKEMSSLWSQATSNKYTISIKEDKTVQDTVIRKLAQQQYLSLHYCTNFSNSTNRRAFHHSYSTWLTISGRKKSAGQVHLLEYLPLNTKSEHIQDANTGILPSIRVAANPFFTVSKLLHQLGCKFLPCLLPGEDQMSLIIWSS